MSRPPRDPNEKILSAGILFKSILQGIVIFVASFGLYLLFLGLYPDDPSLARTMGLVTIILSNLFLVQVNSSNYDFAIQSMRQLAGDKVMWIVSIGTFAGLLLILYTPLCGFLKLAPLSASQFFLALGTAMLAVTWYEVVKLFNAMHRTNGSS